MIALVTLMLSLLLVAAGGLVTNTGSALAVPDWPTTFGYNMFTYPLSEWKGGVFYEHSHRLLGSAVGFLALALALAAWRWEERKSVRWLAFAVLVAVVVQGVLGGLRVVLLEHGLAIVHGCFAQAFLGLLTVFWVMTAPSWPEIVGSKHGGQGWGMTVLFAALPAATYLQIVFGAFLTHRGAFLWYHLAGAAVVAALVLGVMTLLVTGRLLSPLYRRPAFALAGLLVLQLSLGLLAYLWHYGGMYQRVPFGVGLSLLAAHRVTGSLLWIFSVVLCTRHFAGLRVGPVRSPMIQAAYLGES
jgi:cytochrome c oxidase assembly protein subunit 15